MTGPSDTNGSPDAEDRCGAPTADGDPCRRGPNCPYHQQSEAPDTGRPTKLTRERQERIAAMLEEGHSISAAARANGISHETYHSWIRKGEKQEEGVYAEFSDRMSRARAEGERRYIQKAQEAAIQSKNASVLLKMAQLQYPNSWSQESAKSKVSRENSTGLTVYLSSADEKQSDTSEFKLTPSDEDSRQ